MGNASASLTHVARRAHIFLWGLLGQAPVALLNEAFHNVVKGTTAHSLIEVRNPDLSVVSVPIRVSVDLWLTHFTLQMAYFRLI